MMAWCCVVSVSHAEPETRQEAPQDTRPSYVVKAEFLVHFLEYVDWPAAQTPGPEEPWVIGVTAADEVHGALLRVVRGKLVRAHPVAVRLLTDGDALERVHILYLSGSADAVSWDTSRAGRSLLVVTDDPKGIAAGPGAINFLLTQDRIRFEVSLETAERAGLKVSSRMLQVAHKVTGLR